MKRIAIIFGSLFFLLVVTAILLFYFVKPTPSPSTAFGVKDVYTWFVESDLVNPKEKITVTGEDKDKKIIEQLEGNNGLRITLYSYDYEKEMIQKEAERQNSSKLEPAKPGMEYAIRNLAVLIPEGIGNPTDFEKVLEAKQPIPHMDKTYASAKAKAAVDKFRQKKSFAELADAFNDIETQKAASQTFSHYLENQSVTWSGQVIGLDSLGNLYVHGKPKSYKGERVDEMEQNHRIKDPSIIRYVFVVGSEKKDQFSAFKTGDTVTIQGKLYDFGYQSDKLLSKWFLDHSTVVKHEKGKGSYTTYNPHTVFDWFQRSGLTMFPDNPAFSQTIENGKPVTHLDSLFVRVTSYAYNREGEVGSTEFVPAPGGKEFSIGNITVWVPYGVENAETFRTILRAGKPDVLTVDERTTTTIELRQVALNVYLKKEFPSIVQTFQKLIPAEQPLVFDSYLKEKEAQWNGTIVGVEADRLIVYGGSGTYQEGEPSKPYLFSVRLPDLQSTSKYNVGEKVSVSGRISQYTPMWEVSNAELAQSNK